MHSQIGGTGLEECLWKISHVWQGHREVPSLCLLASNWWGQTMQGHSAHQVCHLRHASHFPVCHLSAEAVSGGTSCASQVTATTFGLQRFPRLRTSQESLRGRAQHTQEALSGALGPIIIGSSKGPHLQWGSDNFTASPSTGHKCAQKHVHHWGRWGIIWVLGEWEGIQLTWRNALHTSCAIIPRRPQEAKGHLEVTLSWDSDSPRVHLSPNCHLLQKEAG